MKFKQTLVAAAVSAAIPMLSYADTLPAPDHTAVLYGQVAVMVNSAGKTQKRIEGLDPNKNNYSQTKLASAGTRIGVKGQDLLADGLHSFYRIELNLDGALGDPDDSQGTYADPSTDMHTRYAYLGVKGDFGTAIVGRQLTTFYEMVNAPVDITYSVDGPLGQYQTYDGKYHVSNNMIVRSDSVKYISPDMSGFTVQAEVGNMYDRTHTDTQGHTSHGSQVVYQAGAKYQFGMGSQKGYVSAAYMKLPKDNLNDAFFDVKDITGVAAGYSFGIFGIDASYSRNGTKQQEKANKINQYTLTGKVTLDQLTAYALYSVQKNKIEHAKAANRIALGVEYAVSKPLSVSFEVGQSNKYANTLLGLRSSAIDDDYFPSYKSNTTFNVSAVYRF